MKWLILFLFLGTLGANAHAEDIYMVQRKDVTCWNEYYQCSTAVYKYTIQSEKQRKAEAARGKDQAEGKVI